MHVLLNAFIIAITCSIDCFVAGFAYGANKVKIRWQSVLIITFMSSAVFGISLFLTEIVGKCIPDKITTAISCSILITVGLYKLFEKQIKTLFSRSKEKKVEPTQENKTLSMTETLVVSLALSIDCFAVGIGAGLVLSGLLSYLSLIGISLITDAVFMTAGRCLGSKLAQKSKINLAWLGGIMLIGLGIVNIFV